MVKTYTESHLWTAFSKYIRLRDSDENGFVRCFTCGRVKFWKEADCGHGIGRHHKGTKFSEKNNHAQCKPCNGFEGGMREAYKKRVDEIYGPGTWDLLTLMSRQPFKMSKFEIHNLTIHYKDLATKLLTEKGLKL